MKLRDKVGLVRLMVIDPDSGKRWLIDPQEELTPRQYRKMCGRPDMILQVAHRVAQRFRSEGYPRIEVRANTMVFLNGRPRQRLIDLDVDLAAEQRSLAPKRWIVPLEYALSDGR